MQSLTNIEPSAFTRGAYVGYAAGAVWSITQGTRCWNAIPRQSDAPAGVKGYRLQAPTLALLSVALENVIPTN